MRPGLIMRPDIVSDPSEVEGEAVDGGVPVEYRAIVDGGGEQPEPNGAGSFGPLVSRFYARFDLDQVRGIRQLEEIMTNVTDHLGSNVKITVEIEAESPAGWGDLNSRPPPSSRLQQPRPDTWRAQLGDRASAAVATRVDFRRR